ncbi:MAG: glucan 1,4-alpha-glucosidase [Gemmatimonadetes bacterium]|nr:glucan 1,4-alpha-glucosidase [Gemmatimonadota bacterium]
MTRFRGDHEAFGRPGIAPRWTHGDKDGVGTAYAASSRLWFTLWKGLVTEVYYPTVDRPQLRDLQYLVSDGETFVHEELRHLESVTERMEPGLAYRVRNADPGGRYVLEKEIIADPHLPCLLVRTRVTGEPQLVSRLKLYALCAPHLEVGGWDNNAWIVDDGGREVLVAEKGGTWLALGASVPFTASSVGYVGRSDGWTDLSRNRRLTWRFDRALAGNVALTGEIDLGAGGATSGFTLGLAFGDGLHGALTALFQGLATAFDQQLDRFQEQWGRPCRSRARLEGASRDGGNLFRTSYNLLLAHEDKTYQGAMIASLSIPWGEAREDREAEGGYHLVWTRDMVNSALALLAGGNRTTPLRALIYLATAQLHDGGFPQNFWIDGRPYWSGVQLDEVAFPILLAHRLLREDALQEFDPYPMVLRAAGFLLRHGPVTDQERWEEASGYSPSTLAACIAALVCAADYARRRGEDASAGFLEQQADFLEGNVELWTVTSRGSLVPGIARHYVRIHPARPGDPLPENGPDDATIVLANQPPGAPAGHPAREIVDAGFLELVRYGIRRADDPLIRDSLRVVDAILKVDTPAGTCWRRYNHDGYGQAEDGGPYVGHGKGRAWPLLAGERGHYELASGGDGRSAVEAFERFASPTGLLPEQVWDAEDIPSEHMYLGKPTGSAMPLLWAHAEYVKLLRSIRDGRVFDRIDAVEERYLGDRRHCHRLQVWSSRYPATTLRPGHVLRVLAESPFRLRWSADGWKTAQDVDGTPTAFGLTFADLPAAADAASALAFTFFWTVEGRWEGRDYTVTVVPQRRESPPAPLRTHHSAPSGPST